MELSDSEEIDFEKEYENLISIVKERENKKDKKSDTEHDILSFIEVHNKSRIHGLINFLERYSLEICLINTINERIEREYNTVDKCRASSIRLSQNNNRA